MTHRPGLRTAALLSMAAVTAFSAHAAGNLILIDKPPADGYTLAVGPSLIGYPTAPGTSRMKVSALPGVDFYSSWGLFASTEIGLGMNFTGRDDLQFGLRLWPVIGRDNDRARQRGLQDIGTRLGKAAFLNYAPWEFLVLQSNVLVGSGEHGDGVLLEGGATVGAPLGSSTLAGITLGATWANAPHMRSYYGVSEAQSARGGLPVYAPRAGLKDVNLALTGETKINERWKISGQVLGALLTDAAKNSPVTESRRETTFSVTLWYQIR